MKNEKEYFGTLTGFTDNASMLALVLQDAKEYSYNGSERILLNKMECCLLNGTHICFMVPGDDEPTPKAINE